MGLHRSLPRVLPATLLFILLSIVPGVLAQDAEWTTIGIQGGMVHRVVVDPTVSTTLYAGTNGGGVFKSVAGGAAWRSIRVGLEDERSAVEDLILDPTEPSRLFVAFRSQRLYRSENGGATWERIGEDFFSGAIRDLEMAPDGTLYAASSCIERSVDAGTTWTSLPGSCFEGTAVAVAPSDPATIYASFSSPDRTLVTRDGGETWRRTSLEHSYPPHIQQLVVDPGNSQVVYAMDYVTVYRSPDGGRTFPRVSLGSPPPGLVHDLVLAADGSGTAYVVTSRHVLRSLDEGESWRPWGTAAPRSPRRLVHAGDSVFLGTQCGIFRTSEQGGAWRASNANLVATEIFTLETSERLPGFVFAGTRNCGLFRSVDGGVSWRRLPLRRSIRQIQDLALDPAEPRRLYAATNGSVVRSLDRGASWFDSGPRSGLDPIPRGERGSDLVRVAPTAPENVYLKVSGRLYHSSDHGATWSRLDLDSVSGHRFAVFWVTVDPTDDETVYVLKGDTLLKTTDGRQTWSLLAEEDLDGPIVVDASESDTLYARSPKDGGWQVAKSVDGGASWTVASTGIEKSVESLELDPRDPSTIYAGATQSGFYVSHDGAESWQPLGGRSDTSLARDLAATGSTVYAATRRGLLALPQACGEELVLEDESISISGISVRSYKLDVALDAAGNAFLTFHAPFGGAAFNTLADGADRPRGYFTRIGGKVFDRSPAVAADGPGEVLVAWQRSVELDQQSILVQRYRVNGEPRGERVEIARGLRNMEPVHFLFEYPTLDIARSRSGDAVVVWAGISRGGKAHLSAQRLSATGKPLGDPIAVRGGVDRILAPAVAMDAFGRFTLVWYESTGDQAPAIRMQAFRRNGVARSDAVTLGTPVTWVPPLGDVSFPVNAPVIDMAPTGETVAAWMEGDDQDQETVVRWFDGAGGEVGEQRVATGGCCAYRMDLAVDGFGHTLLVWRGEGTADILGRVFDMQGRPTSEETVVADEYGEDKHLPAVDFDLRGRAVIAWRRYEDIAMVRRWSLGCSSATD